jgi:formate hydrogenlyase transcriptional activator
MTEPAVQCADWQRRPYRRLLALSTAMTTRRNLTDLLQDLVGHLQGFLDFQSLGIMLYDGAQHVMRWHLLEPSALTGRPIPHEVPLEGSMAGWVWQHQQPWVTRDIHQETRFPAMTWPRDGSVKSACVLPLTAAHQQLGVLTVASDKAGAYDQLDLEFAQLVAAQVAVAVANVLAFQEAASYRRQLEDERDRSRLLLEVANMLVSNLELRDLLRAISASVRRVMRCDAVGVALPEADGDQLRVYALDHPDSMGFVQEEFRLPLDGSLAGQAFRTGKPALLERPDPAELAPEVYRMAAGEAFTSICMLPLISRQRALGTLNLGRRQEPAFTPADVEFLAQVASQVAIAVENALAFHEIETLKNQLAGEKLYLEEEIQTAHNFQEIVGQSLALKRALQQVETVATTDATVLLVGETGTGKELLARAIHQLSPRHERTFVKVNCAAIPTGLLESELFGHEKGAFTGAIERRLGRFELAHQGTIFLDEVGDVPLELQAKLLRVLQERAFERLGSSHTLSVDVRVVAATNQDLARMVADKQFRSDLYYRLHVFPITVPPLRECPEDIPPVGRPGGAATNIINVG